MKDNYRKACKEVFICLKYVDEDLLHLIPIELYTMIVSNMDKDYYFNYDNNKKIYEQDLLEETENLLGYIFYNYWANESEKEEFKKVVIDNSKTKLNNKNV